MGIRSTVGRAAAGRVDIRLTAAIVFAAVGAGAALVVIIGSLGGGSAASTPRPIGSAVDDRGNLVDATYEPSDSDARIERLADTVTARIREQTGTAAGALGLPAHASDAVSGTVRGAFIPIIRGDHASFAEGIRAMGGSIGQDVEGDHPLFDHLVRLFEGAKVDTDRISVTPYDRSARPGPRRRADTDTSAGGDDADDGGPEIAQRIMELSPESLFPDAPSGEDPSALLVTIPVRPKGKEHEHSFGLVLTWNSALGLWQPAKYRIGQTLVFEQEEGP